MMQFTIPKMSCGHCVGAVTKAVHSVDGAAEVTTDLTTKQVTVASGTASREALAAALGDAGYPVQ